MAKSRKIRARHMTNGEFNSRLKSLLDSFTATVKATNIDHARKEYRENGLIYVKSYRVKAFFRKMPSR